MQAFCRWGIYATCSKRKHLCWTFAELPYFLRVGIAQPAKFFHASQPKCIETKELKTLLSILLYALWINVLKGFSIPNTDSYDSKDTSLLRAYELVCHPAPANFSCD